MRRIRYALACLFFSGFFIRLFVIYLDPFLHDWDERFHALVARNMMLDPFKPMLRVNDWLPYDYKIWCCNHTWLHKQPLFMWQMALSMKLFGVSEYSIRYPGVTMGCISILLVYRIGLLMTENAKIAFMSAVLTCYAYFHLELLSGLFGMDQNDIAFDFYVLCSIWAFAEYLNRKTLKFVVLTGLFAGCAVLTKWLPGILVFSAWGIIALLSARKGNFKTDVIHFLLGLLVCCLVFLPWQLYILYQFPKEASYEFAYNSLHLTQAVEGHGGNHFFYLDNFGRYFGSYLYFLSPVGLLLTLFLRRYHKNISLSLAIYFLGAYIFYSYMAQTKETGYFMIVTPLGYVFIVLGIYHIINFRAAERFLFVPATVICALLMLNLPDLTNDHNPINLDVLNHHDWVSKAENTGSIKISVKKCPPA